MSWKRISTYTREAYGNKNFDIELLDNWLAGKNIKTWSTSRMENVPHYLKTGRSTIGYPNHFENNPPHIDHVTFFKATNPNKVWMVFHPYSTINEIKDDVKKWVEKYNLKVEFYSAEYSWYNKNNTAMVVITS